MLNCHDSKTFLVITVLGIFITFLPALRGQDNTIPASRIRAIVEADWEAQEKRLGRSVSSPQAIDAILLAADRLVADLSRRPDGPELGRETVALAKLRSIAADVDGLTDLGRVKLYHDIRWVVRSMALKNPLIANKRILFMKRKRFICQMLHEYLGYYYDYEDISGGGIYLLEQPGYSFAYQDLTKNRLGRGNYTTLALSYDAETIYFAFAARAAKKPDYYSTQRKCFHIYTMNLDGSNVRQITHGPDDDFDPCPLPDGGLAFMSSARGGFTRCNNPWEPLPAHTLHRLDPTMKHRRTLSFHETSEWHPSVLHDGRIVYIRWDYVDRSAANFHGLWIANPDGSSPIALFGNYTMSINACYQPKAIPNSHKLVFLAGAHHADVGGSLVLLDSHRIALDPKTGQDSFDSIEVLTPEVCFPEAPGWPASYFHSPWPLSENYFLVSFSFDPLPGMGPKVKRDTQTGLYYFDRFGNMELLYREKGISSMYPIPLQAREVPPIVPNRLDEELGNEGEFMLTDVRTSHFPMPENRRIVELRVFQVLPKSRTHVANEPRIGHANAESARMLLGTVPVEADGSAYFRAPAKKPLYFQAVDEKGRAVQSMRSVTYLQPGERQGCVGCHEPRNQAMTAQKTRPLAMRRAPSRLKAGPEGTQPFSFPVLVQPIIDKHCVHCHDGNPGPNKSQIALTSDPAGHFTKSYENLKPFVRWYEWGQASIEPIITRPGRVGADVSPLTEVLTDAVHSQCVKLDNDELRQLYIWLDGNVPFYGTYDSNTQLAQKSGRLVPPPTLQ
ncbi:MAG: HzsA-related protein [Planctomycetota bacterium]